MVALRDTADPAGVIRKSGSVVAYLGIPQTKAAFPRDIAARLDSIAVGVTTSPVENKMDNTLNVIKLISKTQMPDSIQFRVISVGGATAEETVKRADSIYTALQAGADFEALAKKYGQTGEKTWLTSAQYQNAPSMDNDTKSYIQALNTLGVNETKNLKMVQGNIILQVTDRKAMTDKYVAAVIKKPIEFSKNTRSAAYNKFSQFVSERADIRNFEHNIAGIGSTHEAMKWLFGAKENEVSPLYECGNNDHLLVVVLTKVNERGYRSLEDENVKNFVKSEVVRDKKAEMLTAKLKGVKNMSGAKSKGAKVSNVNQVTFAASVFVQATGMSEPALSGAVSATAKGKFCSQPVKGYGGVYMFQVVDKKMRPVKFNAKEYEQRQRQRVMQYAGNFMQELYVNANVKDNRYMFF